MGKTVLAQPTSVHGVTQSPGPYQHPVQGTGAGLDFDAGPELARFKLEEAQNAEALLLGRVTHQAMQAFWHTAQGEFADRLNESDGATGFATPIARPRELDQTCFIARR